MPLNDERRVQRLDAFAVGALRVEQPADTFLLAQGGG